MCIVASKIHSFFQQIFTIEVRSVFGAAGPTLRAGMQQKEQGNVTSRPFG